MIEIENYGPVAAMHQGRPVFGFLAPYMTVRCYAVDGLMIDSGLSHFRKEMLLWARERKVERAVLTHHHEDHSGGAGPLQSQGVSVLASPLTGVCLERGFALRMYQRLIWAPAQPARVGVVNATVETAHYCFEVLPAPGHCDDQVALFEPRQGWLFSGDAFLASRIKYFRGDENFAATVDSLERLSRLDFDSLFCAHRPVLGKGRQPLLQKLQYLKDLEGRVRELHEQGLSLRAITRRLLGEEQWWLYLATWGDLSKYNLVRSILYGPKLRADFPT
jgi:glyoxylase-like metal-dependent hydrolase (beta-lactamase superfamily II)